MFSRGGSKNAGGLGLGMDGLSNSAREMGGVSMRGRRPGPLAVGRKIGRGNRYSRLK